MAIHDEIKLQLLHLCNVPSVDWKISLFLLSTFLQMWISRASTTIWPDILHRKC